MVRCARVLSTLIGPIHTPLPHSPPKHKSLNSLGLELMHGHVESAGGGYSKGAIRRSRASSERPGGTPRFYYVSLEDPPITMSPLMSLEAWLGWHSRCSFLFTVAELTVAHKSPSAADPSKRGGAALRGTLRRLAPCAPPPYLLPPQVVRQKNPTSWKGRSCLP